MEELQSVDAFYFAIKSVFELYDILKCSICLEVLNNPISLKCKHSFCSDCLKESQSAVCPLCRKPIHKRDKSPNESATKLAAFIDSIAYQIRNATQFDNLIFMKKARAYEPKSVLPIDQPSTSRHNPVKQIKFSRKSKLKPNKPRGPSDEPTNAFEVLLASSRNDGFARKPLRVYRGKKKVAEEEKEIADKILQFEDYRNKESVLRWLTDSQNDFERVTQTQQGPVSQQHTEEFLASISQGHKRLESQYFHEVNEVKRRRMELRQYGSFTRRCRSLDIQVRKVPLKPRLQRRSIACESQEFEEAVEEVDSEPGNMEKKVDLIHQIEEECLKLMEDNVGAPTENVQASAAIPSLGWKRMKDNVQAPAENEQVSATIPSSGWKRMKDLDKSIRKIERRPKKLKISRASSRKKLGKKEAVGGINQPVNLNEIESFFKKHVGNFIECNDDDSEYSLYLPEKRVKRDATKENCSEDPGKEVEFVCLKTVDRKKQSDHLSKSGAQTGIDKTPFIKINQCNNKQENVSSCTIDPSSSKKKLRKDSFVKSIDDNIFREIFVKNRLQQPQNTSNKDQCCSEKQNPIPTNALKEKTANENEAHRENQCIHNNTSKPKTLKIYSKKNTSDEQQSTNPNQNDTQLQTIFKNKLGEQGKTEENKCKNDEKSYDQQTPLDIICGFTNTENETGDAIRDIVNEVESRNNETGTNMMRVEDCNIKNTTELSITEKHEIMKENVEVSRTEPEKNVRSDVQNVTKNKPDKRNFEKENTQDVNEKHDSKNIYGKPNPPIPVKNIAIRKVNPDQIFTPTAMEIPISVPLLKQKLDSVINANVTNKINTTNICDKVVLVQSKSNFQKFKVLPSKEKQDSQSENNLLGKEKRETGKKYDSLIKSVSDETKENTAHNENQFILHNNTSEPKSETYSNKYNIEEQQSKIQNQIDRQQQNIVENVSDQMKTATELLLLPKENINLDNDLESQLNLSKSSQGKEIIQGESNLRRTEPNNDQVAHGSLKNSQSSINKMADKPISTFQKANESCESMDDTLFSMPTQKIGERNYEEEINLFKKNIRKLQVMLMNTSFASSTSESNPLKECINDVQLSLESLGGADNISQHLNSPVVIDEPSLEIDFSRKENLKPYLDNETACGDFNVPKLNNEKSNENFKHNEGEDISRINKDARQENVQLLDIISGSKLLHGIEKISSEICRNKENSPGIPMQGSFNETITRVKDFGVQVETPSLNKIVETEFKFDKEIQTESEKKPQMKDTGVQFELSMSSKGMQTINVGNKEKSSQTTHEVFDKCVQTDFEDNGFHISSTEAFKTLIMIDSSIQTENNCLHSQNAQKKTLVEGFALSPSFDDIEFETQDMINTDLKAKPNSEKSVTQILRSLQGFDKSETTGLKRFISAPALQNVSRLGRIQSTNANLDKNGNGNQAIINRNKNSFNSTYKENINHNTASTSRDKNWEQHNSNAARDKDLEINQENSHKKPILDKFDSAISITTRVSPKNNTSVTGSHIKDNISVFTSGGKVTSGKLFDDKVDDDKFLVGNNSCSLPVTKHKSEKYLNQYLYGSTNLIFAKDKSPNKLHTNHVELNKSVSTIVLDKTLDGIHSDKSKMGPKKSFNLSSANEPLFHQGSASKTSPHKFSKKKSSQEESDSKISPKKSFAKISPKKSLPKISPKNSFNRSKEIKLKSLVPLEIEVVNEIRSSGESSNLEITLETNPRQGKSEKFKRIRMPSPDSDSDSESHKKRFKKLDNRFMRDDLSVVFDTETQNQNLDEVGSLGSSGFNMDYIDQIWKKIDNGLLGQPTNLPENSRHSVDERPAKKQKVEPVVKSDVQEILEKCDQLIKKKMCTNQYSQNPNTLFTKKQKSQDCPNPSNLDKLIDKEVIADLNQPFVPDISESDELFRSVITSPQSENIFNNSADVTLKPETEADKLMANFNVNDDVDTDFEFFKTVNDKVNRKSEITILQNMVVVLKKQPEFDEDMKIIEDSEEELFTSDEEPDVIENTPVKVLPSKNPLLELNSKKELFPSIIEPIPAPVVSEGFCNERTITPPPEFQDFFGANDDDDLLANVNAEEFKESPPNFNQSAVIRFTQKNTNSEQFVSLSPIGKEFSNKSIQLNPLHMSCSRKSSSTPKSQKQVSIRAFMSRPKTAKERAAELFGVAQPTTVRKPCIACTRLNKDQVIAISALTNKKLATYSAAFNSTVTHMVVSTNEMNCVKDHTIKYVSAVAAGIWVLNFKWIQDCLTKNTILPEEPYEALDVSSIAGPKEARLYSKTNKLLKDFKIYAAPPFLSTTQADLENIIIRLGGKTVANPEELLIKTDGIRLIITETRSTQDFGQYETWLEALGVVTVDIEWLSRSVGQYSLLSLRRFALCSDDTIGNLGYPNKLTENVPFSFSQSVV